MILRQFPNLEWIQKQSKTNFENQRGSGNARLKNKGWPNVVLNTLSKQTERNNIKAPFSLFTNIKGKSLVTADGTSVSLSSDTYCLVNHGDTYDLNIAEDDTLTFNIHFGDQLYNQTIHSSLSPHRSLLDNPFEKPEINHITCSHWKGADVESQIQKLQKFYHPEQALNEDTEDELLSELLVLLLIKNGENTKGLQKINAQKASTRKELVLRASLARDYLHDHFRQPVTLDELAQAAMLSKFHFLRVFKEIYACTPNQYLSSIRLQKAELLLKTKLEIREVAHMIGFEETNSFHQFFKKRKGFTPTEFRNS